MTLRLTKDIFSNKGGKKYGSRNEVVEVISDHGEVLIVKGKETFSVRKENTTPCKSH